MKKPNVKIMTIKAGREFLAEQLSAPEGLVYVCIGPYCWGRSVNAYIAAREARSNGGAGTYTLHLVNKSASVDSVSGTLWYDDKTPGVKAELCHFRQGSY
jgi:hypothetical protein